MIKEGRYIIRRIIIGVAIALILGFINSCEVKAEVIPIQNDGSRAYYSNSTNTLVNFGNWQTPPSSAYLYDIIFNLETGMTSDGYGGTIQETMYAGQYLFDFYIETNYLRTELSNCRGMTSDFSFIDLTSGNRISAANASKSQCLDSYYTTLGGNRAIHYLFSWTITNTASYDYMLNSMKFDIGNGSTGFVTTGGAYMVILGNLQQYDPNIVQNFTNISQQQKNIEDQILNATQNATNIINNQNTNTQTIINNNNSNTNSIINNQDSNTSDIINNQNSNSQNEINAANQNTDKEIKSQLVCKTIDRNNIEINDKYLGINGGEISSTSNYGITEYIRIYKGQIKVLSVYDSTSPSLCFYNTNKTIISCINNGTLQLNQEITIPDNAEYVRFSINKTNNKPTFNVCISGNQSITNSIDDMNSSIKDDTVDDPDEYFDEFEDLMADNGVITDLITLPISLYTKILNNINGTCSPFNLGQLLGTELQFGCINIGNLIGSTLWNIIDIIVSGMFVLIIAKRMIQVFENMTSMKESDDLE